MSEKPKEQWGVGSAYDRYVGRWSRLVAREFLAWLSIPAAKSWVDVGCGTGTLVEAILAAYAPREVIGIDRAEGFLAEARRKISDGRAEFQVGDATVLPLDTGSRDVAVSGLVLNFVPDHRAVVQEMKRVTRPGGSVAAYVWDYAGGMQMIRYFWDAAVAVSPHDANLDQGERFPICRPEPLRALFEEVGLYRVAVQPIEIALHFQNFADYWEPFLGKQGAAPTYLASVDKETRESIRLRLQQRLVPRDDGTILLSARAWAVRGIV